MDFDKTRDPRESWRDERRRWREERRKWREGHRDDARGMAGMYASGRGGGHVWTGLFLLIIGGLALLRAMQFPMPDWLFTWPMLLIGLGMFFAIRSGFRGGAWFILLIVGGVFLVRDFFPDLLLRQYLWPLGLIVLGIFFIMRPHHRHRYWTDYRVSDGQPADQQKASGDTDTAAKDSGSGSSPSPMSSGSLSEDYIDSTSIFGGVKKNVLSKNFKGGDITNIMGGSEIDLRQADINGTATIDLTQIFGGTKLIVPSNWQVKPKMAAIFGGVEDKRSIQSSALDPNKILVLDGTSIFGGIEIRSY